MPQVAPTEVVTSPSVAEKANIPAVVAPVVWTPSVPSGEVALATFASVSSAHSARALATSGKGFITSEEYHTLALLLCRMTAGQQNAVASRNPRLFKQSAKGTTGGHRTALALIAPKGETIDL